MQKNLKVGQAVELIRLKITPENVAAFLEGRQKVDAFVSTIKGYIGTEIVKVSKEEFLMLIRWDNEEAVREAQKITETANVISEWIYATAQFISFETSISMYEN